MSAKPHIFLFYGEDSYNIAKKIRTWIAEFEKKYHSAGITVLEEGVGQPPEAIADRLKQSLTANSLFSPTNLVVLKHLFSGEKKENIELYEQGIVEHLRKASPQTFVVIQEAGVDSKASWYQTLEALATDGRATLIYHESPTGTDLQHWIKQRILEQGGKISIGALTRLVAFFTPLVVPKKGPPKRKSTKPVEPTIDLWGLHHAIEQCIAYAQGREISAADIDRIMPPTQTADFFVFTDALLQGNGRSALQLLSILIDMEGEDSSSAIFSITARLHSTLRDSLLVKNLVEQGMKEAEIASTLGWENPKRVYAVGRKLNHHTTTSLTRLMRALHQLDGDLRSSIKDPEILLERWVISATSSR